MTTVIIAQRIVDRKVGFTGYCDSQHYEKPEGKLLRIVGLLPHPSEDWKMLNGMHHAA